MAGPELKQGQAFHTRCCPDGHHLECNQHKEMKSRWGLQGHNFITISPDKYNKRDSVLAIALTTKESASAWFFNYLYPLDREDIKTKGRLDHSLVRCDCICKINKEHIDRIENTSIKTDGIGRILKKVRDFIMMGG